jgi:hypothetical protein
MRTSIWITSVLGAASLATVMFAEPAIAGGDDDSSYRAEIIERYVNPCAIDIVRQNPAASSISEHDITLVARTLMRTPVEEMLGYWIPKVRVMTKAERLSFYEERLKWCVATEIGTKVHESDPAMAKASIGKAVDE